MCSGSRTRDAVHSIEVRNYRRCEATHNSLQLACGSRLWAEEARLAHNGTLAAAVVDPYFATSVATDDLQVTQISCAHGPRRVARGHHGSDDLDGCPLEPLARPMEPPRVSEGMVRAPDLDVREAVAGPSRLGHSHRGAFCQRSERATAVLLVARRAL